MRSLPEYVYLFTYQEITGDNFKADTQKQGEYDERIRGIIKNADPVLCPDLRINNWRKTKFDSFWGIAESVIKKTTALDHRRQTQSFTTSADVAVNMAIAISAREILSKCKTVSAELVSQKLLI